MDKEYIEREKVKEVIKLFGKGAIEDGQKVLDPVDDIILLAKAMDMLPTADVAEVRHGEWKIESDPINDPKGYFIRIVCSECGLKTGQKSNYCPNCGAKMKGAEE